MSNKGKLFVIGGPAGTGKTTLVNMLTKDYANLKKSVSYTTRPKRDGEQDGVDYFFIEEKDFLERLQSKEIIEHVYLYGYYYGTSRKCIDNALEKGQSTLLVIDSEGASSLEQAFEVVKICLHPPSMDELHRRLLKRGASSPEDVERRMSRALFELDMAKDYEYHIINDDLESAYRRLKEILVHEGVVT